MLIKKILFFLNVYRSVCVYCSVELKPDTKHWTARHNEFWYRLAKEGATRIWWILLCFGYICWPHLEEPLKWDSLEAVLQPVL